MKTKELIERHTKFLQSLEEHKNLYFNSLYSGEVVANQEKIEKQEQELNRQFGALEPYIRRHSYVEGNQLGETYDLWISALTDDLPLRKAPNLRFIIKEVNRIIGFLETTEVEQILLEDLQILFDCLKLHNDIVRVSKRAFESKLYAEAILNAYKEVIVRVREISGLRELDGVPLMEQAFSPRNPKIKLNNLQTPSERDEQAGFLSIFRGVALGIRNPKAHENIEQEDPYKTLEYLSFASLLMKRLDESIEPT